MGVTGPAEPVLSYRGAHMSVINQLFWVLVYEGPQKCRAQGRSLSCLYQEQYWLVEMCVVAKFLESHVATSIKMYMGSAKWRVG